MKYFSKVIWILFLFGLTAMPGGFCQDTLITRYSRDTILVKVLDVTPQIVNYKFWPGNPDQPLITERKDWIRQIRYENGTVENISLYEFHFQSPYYHSKPQLLKLDVFSLIFGTTSIAYERGFRVNSSYEIGIGIIGAGITPTDNGEGIFARAGIKYIFLPDLFLNVNKAWYGLNGIYIRTDFVFHNFTGKSNISGDPRYLSSSIYEVDYFTIKRKYEASALLFNIGYQVNLNPLLILDFFIGFGPGYGVSTSEKNYAYTISYSGFWADWDETERRNPIGKGLIINYSESFKIATQAGFKACFSLNKNKKSGK